MSSLVEEYNNTQSIDRKIEILKHLVVIYPNDHKILYSLGILLYSETDNVEDSIIYLEKAVGIEDDNFDYLLETALICFYNLSFKKALFYFEKAYYIGKLNKNEKLYLIEPKIDVLKKILSSEPIPFPKDRNKRIALCISGRMLGKEYKSFKKNIIDLYDKVDIFIHTWYDSNIDYNFLDEIGVTDHIIEKYEPSKFNVVTNNLKNRIYDPSPYSSKDELYNRNRFYNNNSPMYYGIYKTLKMKRNYELSNNFIYDVVIRIRSDVSIIGCLNLDILEISKNDNIIYHPVLSTSEEKTIKCSEVSQLKKFKVVNKLDKIHDTICKNNNIPFYDLWLDDFILFGNSKMMDKYSLIYKKLYKNELDIFPIPEIINHLFFIENKIEIKKVYNLPYFFNKKH
jgi:tetratricopeptide (TPR) repeat protein